MKMSLRIIRTRVVISLILLLVVLITSWSRLRHVDASDHEPQRIPVKMHPAFR
ncbi:MAG: hypothetical protein LGR52_13435 [Candidatus Thiosymbion ectosymbiont of Robbea hypermnestra]|nr:hypothetical protein [Candidatus Thiosymbion ectosymbiont of Robbea hypermnestra]